MHTTSTAEGLREFLQHYAAWPISFHSFTGEQIQPSFGKENLLDLLMQRERVVCDSNACWGDHAARNKTKAFIVPHTALDEPPDVQGNVFGRRVDHSNENIFFFTSISREIGLCLAIERYDSHFIERFPDKFKMESRERVEKRDPKFLKTESERMAEVRGEKENILAMLKPIDIENLPPVSVTERKKDEIIHYVRSVGPKCFKDFRLSMNIAGLCYGALLLERDSVGKKTRSEFCDPNRRNVFGDTLLFRDALWFSARILSNDRAIARMAEYIALSEIKVTGMV